MSRRTNEFQTIRSEGGLLPPDLLRRILAPSSKLEGTRAEDYGLAKSQPLNEAITQSWNRLQRFWVDYREALSDLRDDDPATGLTNERWTLPVLRELQFGQLPTSSGPEIEGKKYPISRFLGSAPIHLLGARVSLDKRTLGVAGAASSNPHGMVQEFLNRTSDNLWGIVSNGLRFRILRDNHALSRQSFVEFDLEAMFDGEVYSDFVLFWLICHATRFVVKEGEPIENCWLERWAKDAQETGTRALGELRQGVEDALRILGEGFTSHPHNADLREKLRSGDLKLTDLHAQLLRVVYRLIFLFVAEDRTIEGRPLLHPIDNSPQAKLARARYHANYSASRLRDLASKIKGSRHGDLWKQWNLVVEALSGEDNSDQVRKHLALPTLGSFLWDVGMTPDLHAAEITNFDLLEAIRNLAFIRSGKVLRLIDYKNLGAEELGGVYESLLALTPQISADGARFTFAELAGNERKTSGSYYTPDSLVQCLLDSALDPVVEDVIKGKAGAEAEQAILGLKVCDPAVGSGHFLVGAAHRLARHLARVRAQTQGESEPSPLLYQHALRDVIGRCLYGVDLNPMAAELCRVSLWLEALEPGKPLSFLDHHIRVGNSLLGTTPELIAGGLPDEAFNPIEGDDKKACTELKKRNQAEGKGLGSLFVAEDAERAEALRSAAEAVDEMDDDTPERLARKAQTFAEAQTRYDYVAARRLADAWCAAFVIRKHFPPLPHNPRFTDTKPFGITQGHLGDLAQGRDLPAELAAEVDRLARQFQFFHWYLAFPEVFARGGFDCVLGNPPWERVSLEEKQWFAAHGREDIANAQTGAIRKRLIEQLETDDPAVYRAFVDDVRQAEGESNFLRNSGRYPFCGRGRVNLYAVFAEGMRSVLNRSGLVGAVLPTGIATDDTTKLFFQDVVEKKSLRSLFDFENRNELFPGVHREQKFCLFTSGPVQARAVGATLSSAEFAFFCLDVGDTRHPDKRFFLTPDDIALLNPNTYTCPIFRARRDAELAKAIYRRVPVLIREAREGQPEENYWGISFKQGLFNMTTDSALFQTRKSLEVGGSVLDGNIFRKEGIKFLPLYEGKLTGIMDHRVGSFEGVPEEEIGRGNEREPATLDKELPTFSIVPRWWVDASLVHISSRDQNESWWLTFHDIANPNNERSFVPTVIPGCAVGNTLPIIELAGERSNGGLLAANQSAFCHDYVSRLKISSRHFNFFVVKQLPVVRPDVYASACGWETDKANLRAWMAPRFLELTCTAWDLEAFARDCGWDGPPFRWDNERRFLIRCELDAAFFHLYLPTDAEGQWLPARKADGCQVEETPEDLAELKRHFATPRDAVAYIMDTFPIVRRRDEEKYNGDYRTKRVILEIYDAMQEAICTGQPYQTRLTPPPGPPQNAGGKFIPYAQIAHDPPPHIHLPKDVAQAANVDLQLSDLGRNFPHSHFVLRIRKSGDWIRYRVTPVPPDGIAAEDHVVIAAPNLKRQQTVVPAAIGKVTVQTRIDAATDEEHVLITVRGDDGILTQTRLSHDSWRNLKTIGRLEVIN